MRYRDGDEVLRLRDSHFESGCHIETQIASRTWFRGQGAGITNDICQGTP